MDASAELKLYDLRMSHSLMNLKKVFKGAVTCVEGVGDHKIAVAGINGDLKMFDLRSIVHQDADASVDKLFSTKFESEVYNLE